MCTSFVVRTQDGSPLYGRTMEWGAFDLDSELVLVPRGTGFTSTLPKDATGLTWTSVFGFVSINPGGMPLITDGMNEAGLTVGVLYMPGFARYQDAVGGREANTLAHVDLAAYLLSRFDSVEAVEAAMPTLTVINTPSVEEDFGAPAPIHWIVIDDSGRSLVIEYVDGRMCLYDNRIGVMTNSPGYDWHLLNLRNYANLQAQDIPQGRSLDGVDLSPFGAGSGMLGLPGDFTPPSRFVRAVAYTRTMLPSPDAETGLVEVARVLHNFDIPKGLVRAGEHDGQLVAGQTQWSVIGDLRNRRYCYWTQHNRRMRMVDLRRLDFDRGPVRSVPLDTVRHEDIEDRTDDFS